MEKAGSKRAGATQGRGKARIAAAVTLPKAAEQVVQVVASDDVRGAHDADDPSSASNAARISRRAQAPATSAAATARVEPVRTHGSEHGATVSKTDHLKARFMALNSATDRKSVV